MNHHLSDSTLFRALFTVELNHGINVKKKLFLVLNHSLPHEFIPKVWNKLWNKLVPKRLFQTFGTSLFQTFDVIPNLELTLHPSPPFFPNTIAPDSHTNFQSESISKVIATTHTLSPVHAFNESKE